MAIRDSNHSGLICSQAAYYNQRNEIGFVGLRVLARYLLSLGLERESHCCQSAESAYVLRFGYSLHKEQDRIRWSGWISLPIHRYAFARKQRLRKVALA